MRISDLSSCGALFVAGEELRDEIEELEWLVDAPDEFVVVPEGLGIRYFDDLLRVDSGD